MMTAQEFEKKTIDSLKGETGKAVSYTHLTLPTMCVV